MHMETERIEKRHERLFLPSRFVYEEKGFADMMNLSPTFCSCRQKRMPSVESISTIREGENGWLKSAPLSIQMNSIPIGWIRRHRSVNLVNENSVHRE